MACLHHILTVLRITYLLGWFPIAFPVVFIFLSVLLLWKILPNCRDFPLTSLSLASSHFLMHIARVQFVRHYWVTCT